MKCSACRSSVSGALKCGCGAQFCSTGCMGMHLCTERLEGAIHACRVAHDHARRAS